MAAYFDSWRLVTDSVWLEQPAGKAAMRKRYSNSSASNVRLLQTLWRQQCTGFPASVLPTD